MVSVCIGYVRQSRALGWYLSLDVEATVGMGVVG
jgi:hypothetical protein